MQKTEKPTKRKLQKARLEGDNPTSPLLVFAACLMLALASLPSLARATVQSFGSELNIALASNGDLASITTDLPSRLSKSILLLTVPLLLVCFASALLVGLVQTAGHLSWKRVGFDLGRLKPGAALMGMFSGERCWSVVRGVFAAGAVVYATLFVLRHRALDTVGTLGSVSSALSVLGSVVYELAWVAAGVALCLGALDFLFQHRAWLLRHRMSRAEIEREARDTEADPELRAQRRRTHAQETRKPANYGNQA